MTLSEMQTRVWERLEEAESDPQRYSADDVTEYLNDAVQHLGSRAGLWTATATLTQTADALFVNLPADCILIENVFRESTHWSLEATNVYELDRGARYDANIRWPLQTATAARAYFPFGLSEIALWPRNTEDGEEYTLTYRQDSGATALADATDEPDFPEDYHEALVDYAVGRCLLVDGALDQAAERMARFDSVVQHAKQRRADAGRAWEKNSGVVLR